MVVCCGCDYSSCFLHCLHMLCIYTTLFRYLLSDVLTSDTNVLTFQYLRAASEPSRAEPHRTVPIVVATHRWDRARDRRTLHRRGSTHSAEAVWDGKGAATGGLHGAPVAAAVASAAAAGALDKSGSVAGHGSRDKPAASTQGPGRTDRHASCNQARGADRDDMSWGLRRDAGGC